MIYRGTASIVIRDSVATRVCFVEASSDSHAMAQICEGVALIYGITPFAVGVSDLKNEDQLKVKGLSRNAMWRLFEGGWSNGRCNEWIVAPLFLLPDTRLLNVWASLPVAGGGEIFTELMLPAEQAWSQVAMNKMDALILAIEEDDEDDENRLRHELSVLHELLQHKAFGHSTETAELAKQVNRMLGC